MARRTTKNATPAAQPAHDRAHTISEKIGDQVRTLFNRNWREIQEILDDGDTGNEIHLSFKVVVTDRPAQPGEHQSKDNRIKCNLGFAVKTSDAIESSIPDPDQPDLPGADISAPGEEPPV